MIRCFSTLRARLLRRLDKGAVNSFMVWCRSLREAFDTSPSPAREEEKYARLNHATAVYGAGTRLPSTPAGGLAQGTPISAAGAVLRLAVGLVGAVLLISWVWLAVQCSMAPDEPSTSERTYLR